MDTTSRRSAFAEIRSCSMNRVRKCLTRSRSRMVRHYLDNLCRGPLGIVTQHELRKYVLERMAVRQPLKRLDAVISHDLALMDDDDAAAGFFDQFQYVGAV